LKNEVHSAQDAAKDATGPADGVEKISKRAGRFKRMSAWLLKARDPLKCVRVMADTALDQTEKVICIELLFGVSLEPVVTYEVKVPDPGKFSEENRQKLEAMMKKAASFAQVGLGIAAAWNVGCGAARLFGLPLPKAGTKALKSAKYELGALQEKASPAEDESADVRALAVAESINVEEMKRVCRLPGGARKGAETRLETQAAPRRGPVGAREGNLCEHRGAHGNIWSPGHGQGEAAAVTGGKRSARSKKGRIVRCE